MKDINKVILIGRLGADPVQRQTKEGLAVIHFSLATSRKLQTEGKAPESPTEETMWHKIVAWGKLGENCAQYLRKGASVYVEGSLRSQKYEGKDGVQRVAIEVHADDVSFLNSPRAKVSEPAEAAVDDLN